MYKIIYAVSLVLMFSTFGCRQKADLDDYADGVYDLKYYEPGNPNDQTICWGASGIDILFVVAAGPSNGYSNNSSWNRGLYQMCNTISFADGRKCIVVATKQRNEKRISSLKVNGIAYDLSKGNFLQLTQEGKCKQAQGIPEDILKSTRTAIERLPKNGNNPGKAESGDGK